MELIKNEGEPTFCPTCKTYKPREYFLERSAPRRFQEGMCSDCVSEQEMRLRLGGYEIEEDQPYSEDIPHERYDIYLRDRRGKAFLIGGYIDMGIVDWNIEFFQKVNCFLDSGGRYLAVRGPKNPLKALRMVKRQGLGGECTFEIERYERKGDYWDLTIYFGRNPLDTKKDFEYRIFSGRYLRLLASFVNEMGEVETRLEYYCARGGGDTFSGYCFETELEASFLARIHHMKRLCPTCNPSSPFERNPSR